MRYTSWTKPRKKIFIAFLLPKHVTLTCLWIWPFYVIIIIINFFNKSWQTQPVYNESHIEADTVRRLKSIRIFIDAYNKKIAVVKLCWFGYHCFVMWSGPKEITEAWAFRQKLAGLRSLDEMKIGMGFILSKRHGIQVNNWDRGWLYEVPYLIPLLLPFPLLSSFLFPLSFTLSFLLNPGTGFGGTF